VLHRWQVARAGVGWRMVGSLRWVVVVIRTTLLLCPSLLIGVSLILGTANLRGAASDGFNQRARRSAVVPVVHLGAGLIRRRLLHRRFLLPFSVALGTSGSRAVSVALRSSNLSC